MEDSLKTALKELKQNESTISMLLGSLVIIIVGVLLYNYFTQSNSRSARITDESTSTESEQLAENEQNKTELPTTHVVQNGEHLWSIAQNYYGSGYNWVDIAETNGLGSGDLLAAGTTISIPDAPVRIPGEEVPTKRVVSQPVLVSASIDGDGHTVAQGDTLWSIAVRAYSDGYQWPRLYDANSDIISDPSTLIVGQVLRIPRLEQL